MGLSYELSEIENWREKCLDPQGQAGIKPVTQALVFVTMAIGFGVITAKNHVEFAARAYVHERVHGAMRYGPEPEHAPVYITLQEVEDHIGLRTNVSGMSKTNWAGNLLTGIMRELQYKAANPDV